MSLSAGHTLAHYEIVERIGKGGMGEVYRAHDIKLGRDVAIKVLPEELSRNKERLDRFEREARLLAQLSHANIATLHALEEHHGQQFLVMELVEGETLAERITRGPLTVNDAVPLFTQIAEGLEAAHENGIIHRDLKPANIKIAPDGKPKILDFGLAKAFVGAPESMDPSQSPTVTKGTALGAILGTASYMSPEQSRAKQVDKRTDIWAFGCCLYEALAGKKAFNGETTTDILSAVIRNEPDWEELPARLPRRLRRLLRRCLTTDPNERLHDIADARLEMTQVDDDDDPRRPTRVPARPLLVAVPLAAFLCGAVVWAVLSGPPEPRATRKLTITLPPEQRIAVSRYAPPIALSPDGNLLAYIATEAGGQQQIFLRPLGAFEAGAVPGTEGAVSLFFSPDSLWIGFLADREIRKVPISGGAPTTLLERRSDYTFASWGKEDTILLVEPPRQLTQLPAAGGSPSSSTVDDDRISEFLLWPQHLPALDRLLVTTATEKNLGVASISLSTGFVRFLALGNAPVGAAKYLPTGHLLYSQSGGLWLVPFDLERGEPTGDPTSAVDRVLEIPTILIGANSHFTVSESGSLAYLPPTHEKPSSVLVSVDREGNESVLSETEGHFVYPRVSPEGRRVAVALSSPDGEDIWILDTNRNSRARFTTQGQNMEPVWAPDGRWIAFASTRAGSWDLWWKPTEGSGQAELLLERESVQFPESWSPDGSVLAFYERAPETGLDLYTLDVDGGRVASALLVTPANEHSPVFSPDGRWVAYVSDETGQEEIYLQPFPSTGQRESVSTSGGREVTWSADGRELYYRRGHQVMAVSIRTEPTLELGEPRVMFEAPYVSEPGGGISYSPAGDGESFVMVRHGDDVAPREIHVVLNWFDEVKRLAPTNN